MLASFMKFNNSNVACNLHLIVVVMLNLKFSSGHMNFTEFGLDADEFVGVIEGTLLPATAAQSETAADFAAEMEGETKHAETENQE